MTKFWMRTQGKNSRLQNERGVALIIVLLVTALLIALVFEFAYATRVSLRSAMNFRDSQRAYFLARSGVNYFIKNAAYVKDNLLQGEWGVVPMVSTGDTELRIKWEDESGKINLRAMMSKNDLTYTRVAELFSNNGIDPNLSDKILETSNSKIQLVTELHKYMADEDYNKVAPFLTANAYSGRDININTAAAAVLRSALPNNIATVNSILSDRKDKSLGSTLLTGELATGFTINSTVSKISSYATVGGYTKQVEAITNGAVVDYWRAL